MLSITKLFANHIKDKLYYLEESLYATNFDELIISSGIFRSSFANQTYNNFDYVPHFRHYCPLNEPYHILKLKPGKKPVLIYYTPKDFWHSPLKIDNAFWLEHFNIQVSPDFDYSWSRAINNSTKIKLAYIGNDFMRAKDLGITINPTKLTNLLDYERSRKTPYEIRCIEEATEISANGHIAGQNAFHSGASERDIHYSFLKATHSLESELLFTDIIAVDENSATLHYSHKQQKNNGKVLLMDCGTQVRGYTADITRTTVSKYCDNRFRDILETMKVQQKEIVAELAPNVCFEQIKQIAQIKLANLLNEHKIVNVNPETSIATGLTQVFCPHGLGHHLGLQVHDVTHSLKNEQTSCDNLQTKNNPYAIDKLEANNVITIEPGCYFIPSLLSNIKKTRYSKYLNWDLINNISNLGGIRIEDNILITNNSYRNITREYLPN